MPFLRDVAFTDLFLEYDLENSRIRGYDHHADLQPLPHDLKDEIRRLYKAVDATYRQSDEAMEFSVPFDDVMYRVAVIQDVRQTVFALRRGAVHLPAFEQCGVDAQIVKKMGQIKSGLVLFSGSFSAGKTTAASSYVLYKTMMGGLSITLEDPPELNLSGDHGRGRCLQVPIEREHIEKAIESTLRMSFDLLFVSEIRTPKIASEVINASINGKLIVSTIHSDGAVSSVSRLASLAQAGAGIGGGNQAQSRIFQEMLASGLAAVVHMTKLSEDRRAATEYLLGNQETKSKIAAGEFQSLQNSINILKNKLVNKIALE